MRTLMTSGLVAGVLSLGAITQAADLDANLEARMATAKAGEHLAALVYLAHQVDMEALDAAIKENRMPKRDRNREVITALQDVASFGQVDLLDWLDQQPDTRVSSFTPFWITSVIAVEADVDTLGEIVARDDVMLVALDYPIEGTDPIEPNGDVGAARSAGGIEVGVIAVRAPEVWDMGYTGEGVLVSNIDTGVDGSHPALASRWRGLDPGYSGNPEWAWLDPYLGNNTFPYDGGSHGTHTMGSVVGGAPGNQIGVAPGAQWIAAGAIDRGGGISGTVADAIESFQWMVNPDNNPLTSFDVPDTCSNSWGLVTAHGYPECDQTFWQFIDNCEAAGVIVIFSAGNEASSGLRRPGDRALDDYRTMAVAAIDPHNSSWPIASFSSRGPTNCTASGSSAIKPDIAAPGVDTYSSVPGGYSTYSGTSMASPHINGVMALMLQAAPELTHEQVKQIIYDTAVDLGSVGKDNDYGYGMVDAVAAVEMALQTTTLYFEYLDERPELVDPAGGTTLSVAIGGNVDVEPGTATLHVGVSGVASEYPLVETPGGYDVVFPSFECGVTVSWYLSVESVEGDYVTSPYDAPGDAWAAMAWSGQELSFDDDFETDQGWTVSGDALDGQWTRGTPVGGGDRGDPPVDGDNSGQCYLTDNEDGNSDVDDGSTILTSPMMDASDADATLMYRRWYDNTFGADPYNDVFTVDVSDNNGLSWTTLEVVGPSGSEVEGGWIAKEFRVGDMAGITPSDQFRIRFTASDLSDGSVVEAGVDGVMISRYYCDETSMPGDADGDGDVDTDDLLAAISQWGPCPDGCGADFDGDGDVDTDDILTILANFGA